MALSILRIPVMNDVPTGGAKVKLRVGRDWRYAGAR
jgi:hypothetical protein